MQQFLPNKANFLIWINMAVIITGLYLFNWQPVSIVFAYVFETIIIGLIHIVKLWMVYKYGKNQESVKTTRLPKNLSGIGIIPFFFTHYFLFVTVQSIFIFSFMSKHVPGISDNGLDLFKNYFYLFSQTDMIMAFVCIGLANIGYAMRNFFIPKRYQDFTVIALFLQPYVRIFVQQLLSIIPAFLFFFMNDGKIIALILIIARTTLDLYFVALKQNVALREQLVRSITQNGKLKTIPITEKHIDLLLE